MNETHPFVTYLEGRREDRGALAALRRGLGRPPGTVATMYPYLVPWFGEDTPPWQESAFYLVAGLFAYHPDEGGKGNVGAHMRASVASEGDLPAIERRFTALLAAHPDDLDTYLRQAIGFLKSRNVPVNWHQLLFDVLAWSYPDRRVQKQWARAFWGRAANQD